MKTLTILFILTSHGMIGQSGEPTGLWLEELSTPYYQFKEAGYAVEVASIKASQLTEGQRAELKQRLSEPYELATPAEVAAMYAKY